MVTLWEVALEGVRASSSVFLFSNFIMIFTSIVSAVGLLAAGASAHGAVTSYSIGGTTYPGYVRYTIICRIHKY